MSKPVIYLIDASIYIFRAWFSLPSELTNYEGQPVNAAYGFTRFLTEFVELTQATHAVVAFDESLTQSFRNDIYPQYKMNRELPPAELERQFVLCKRIAQAAGFYCVAHHRYEADDLIATISHEMQQQGNKIVVVSADKDLTQVLTVNDIFWDFARKQQLDTAAVKEKFGVEPQYIADYLGLCGDAVDNIPGVPGVGTKTAAALLQAFSNMDALYANLDTVIDLPIRGAKKLSEKLIQYRDQAYLSKELATVARDAPIDCGLNLLQRQNAEVSELNECVHLMGGRGDGLCERLLQEARSVTVA